MRGRVNIDQSTICYISIDSSQLPLQTNGKLFFSNSEFFFGLMVENGKVFKRIARREY